MCSFYLHEYDIHIKSTEFYIYRYVILHTKFYILYFIDYIY